MSTEDFFKRLANLLNERTNPTDLKASMIGKVVKLSPITIQIDNGNALLVENDELEISEWFCRSKICYLEVFEKQNRH